MHWPVILIKLWPALCLIVIMLLSGCPSAPVIKSEPQPPESKGMDTTTYHIVERGETLLGIATRYGRDYKDVARWNGISPPYALNPGQYLRIDGPSQEKTTTLPKPDNAGIPVVTPTVPESIPIATPPVSEPLSTEETHTVEAGETLYAIAHNYEQNVNDVAIWNNIEPPYHLRIGQILVVSPPSATKPIQAPPSPIEENRDYHVVLPGDTLYKIAKHYGFGVADIAAWNGLQPPYTLSVEQKLRVSPPDANTVLPTLPSPSTFPSDDNSDYHKVAPKETLYSISQRYGYSVEQLIEWNNLDGTDLSIGQLLRVVPPTTMMPKMTPDSRYLHSVGFSSSKSNYHIVEPGETLQTIAKKYGVSLPDLANWNGIGNPYTVYPGLKLTIVPH